MDDKFSETVENRKIFVYNKLCTDFYSFIRTLAIEEAGVSFGTAIRSKEQYPFDIQEMIKEAETAMYTAKEEFYHQNGTIKRER